MLTQHRLPPLNSQSPKQVVLFLHGYGDSGSGGLLSIGELWQSQLPDCEFLCPDAPCPIEQGPPGSGGRQWFGLTSLEPSDVLWGVEKAAPFLNEYIDYVLKSRQLPSNRLTVVGFSQGTMMALYVAPRRKDAVAGVIGYSGLLVGGATLSEDKKSTMPVLLVHGREDSVVPFAAMHDAELGLKKAAFPVETLACAGTAHSIDERGITEGLRFIRKAFGI